MFEGIRGNSYQGDIALDDITLKLGECILPGMFDIKVRRIVFFCAISHGLFRVDVCFSDTRSIRVDSYWTSRRTVQNW